MPILPFPPDRRATKPRRLIVDPLPKEVLDHLVGRLPSWKDETAAERAARIADHTAEVMSYKPRNSADAMMAVQCIALRHLAEACERDAARHDISEALVLKNLKFAKQFHKQRADMEKMLGRRQAQPAVKQDPAVYQALGLQRYLIPDPEDTAQAEQAASAIIVPMHPAPKMLQ